MKKIITGFIIVLAFLAGIFVTQLALTNKQPNDLPVTQQGKISEYTFIKASYPENRF